MEPKAIVVTSLTELKPGDHISWPTGWGPSHHAIVIEVVLAPRQVPAVRVIHYYSDGKFNIEEATVREDTMTDLDQYVNSGDLWRYEYEESSCLCHEDVLEKARSRIGENEYSLRKNNCEHFASWCKTGDGRSRQVETVTTAAAVGGGLLLLGSLIGGAAYVANKKKNREEQQRFY